LKVSTIARALAHDLRGAIAAASSNIDFARSQELTPEVQAALEESQRGLRLASDVVAILGTSGERPLEVDLRALLLIHRGSSALAIDSTEPPFLVTGDIADLTSVGVSLCSIGSRARVRSQADRCALEPVDPGGARAVIASEKLAAVGVLGQLTGHMLVLTRKD
jgi:hypothetical protein